MEISAAGDSARLAILYAWKTDSLRVLNASAKPNPYFTSEGPDIIRTLFIGRRDLLGK